MEQEQQSKQQEDEQKVRCNYFSPYVFGLCCTLVWIYALAANLCLWILIQSGTLSRQDVHDHSSPYYTLKNEHADTKDENDGDCRRRVVIVTGSNTGIGLQLVQALLERCQNMDIIMACRSRDKALKAIATLSRPPNNNDSKAIFLHPLDLSDTDSIHAFCNVVKERYTAIDVLVNNAGMNNFGIDEKEQAKRSLDITFDTNFLGHFVLTSQLLPLLQKTTTEARIVNLSSVMHYFCHSNTTTAKNLASVDYWIDCMKKKNKNNKNDYPDPYCLSKLAAILFTIELNRRYKIRSFAVNPGAVNSDIWRNFPRWLTPFFSLIFLTTKQGCQTSLAAALGSEWQDEKYAAQQQSNSPSAMIQYLQPYWIPPLPILNTELHWFPLLPSLEMQGPFVETAQVTKPCLPPNANAIAAALWEASLRVTQCSFDNDDNEDDKNKTL